MLKLKDKLSEGDGGQFSDNEKMVALAQKGDDAVKEQLVIKNSGLVWGIARKFSKNLDLEDLYQIGCIGLLKAIKNFDPSFNVRFSTYAVPMIIGEIRRFLRDDGIIKVSRSIKDTARRAFKIREEITSKTGREPTLSELSKELGISPEELAVALDAVIPPESLYAPLPGGDDLSLEGIIPAKCKEEELLSKLSIDGALEKLKDEERKLITLRYFKGYTQVQTAEVFGISQVQVSRLERKILLKMRKLIE